MPGTGESVDVTGFADTLLRYADSQFYFPPFCFSLLPAQVLNKAFFLSKVTSFVCANMELCLF